MRSPAQGGTAVALPRKAVPTIHDVAREAGVSIGTASKALNGRGRLRFETTARVRDAAERLGFRPNDLMRSVLRGTSGTIGLLTRDGSNQDPFSLALLSGIEDALEAAEISVFLCSVRHDAQRERQHINALLAKRVDGIVVTGNRTDARSPIDLGPARVPVIYAYMQVTDPEALCLLPDDAHGAHLATEHLVRHGRRHLAYIGGLSDYEATGLRRASFCRVLEEHGIAVPERRLLTGPWTEPWGAAAVGHLLRCDPEIDALFCANDRIARGALDGLHDLGVRVPDDIAVIGYDNLEVVAGATRPPLTSVDPDLYGLGRETGTRLLRMLSGHAEAGTQRLPCQLEVRSSCGCCPA